jgi:hypothetical protein
MIIIVSSALTSNILPAIEACLPIQGISLPTNILANLESEFFVVVSRTKGSPNTSLGRRHAEMGKLEGCPQD